VARSHGFPARSRRQTIWSGILVHAAGFALASDSKSTGGASSLGVTTSGATLIRTRGTGSVKMDPAAADASGVLAIGLGIYSSDAFTAGAASLPSPLTDLDYDWVWHSLFSLGPSTAVVVADEESSIMLCRSFEIDSKAMRILKPSQTMGFSIEATVYTGANTFDFNVNVRQLFKLG